MADFVSKTLGTLTNILSDGKSNKPTFLSCSSDLDNFARKLKGAFSREEEETIVTNYLSLAQRQLLQPNVKESEIESCVLLAMVCESLGYSASFIHVHAIKLAQKGNLRQKHTGYMAASVLLGPKHELVILLINTIQKDLESQDCDEIILGLKAVCSLICTETVHNVMYLVEEKLYHKHGEVRKVAVLALDHCLNLVASESAYKLALPKLEKALSDIDLGVVSVAVPVIYRLIQQCPGNFTYLVDSLIQLQSQLIQRKLPRDMIYHSVPAPWLQVQILKLFAVLCSDAQLSEKVFPILKETLLKAEVNHNSAYAIIAEFVGTVMSIKYSPDMFQMALLAANKLLNSENGNLKYVGFQAFSIVVQKVKPVLTTTQQENILKSLDHPDDALQQKTLDLLYCLANQSNAKAVCRKLLDVMVLKTDVDIKRNLAAKVLMIANQYHHGHDKNWYVLTINEVLMEVGDCISSENISEVIDIIQSDSSGDLKNSAKEIYLEMCQSICPTTSMIKIIASVIDEPSEFEKVLPQIFQDINDTAAVWLIVSLQYAMMRTKKCSEKLESILLSKKCISKQLQKVVDETLCFSYEMRRIQSKEFTNEVDITLSFLDKYVNEALLSGASSYVPQRLRVAQLIDQSSFEQIRELSRSSSHMTALSNPVDEKVRTSSSKSVSYNSLGSSNISSQIYSLPSDPLYSASTAKNVWSKEGRLKESECSVSEQIKKQDSVSAAENLFAGVSQ